MADITITPASVLASANAVLGDGTAGGNMTAGQAVYVDTSDSNKIKLCETTATKSAFAGITLHAALTGQPIRYAKEDADFTIGATVAVGEVYTIADTAGGIRPHSDNGTGDYVTVIGVGISTSKIAFVANSKLRAGAAHA